MRELARQLQPYVFAAITAVSTLFAQRLLQNKQLQAMLAGDRLPADDVPEP